MSPLFSPLGSEMWSVVKPLCFPWDLLCTLRCIPGIQSLFWPEGWGGRGSPRPCTVELGMVSVCRPGFINYPEACFVFVDPGLSVSSFFPLVSGLLWFFFMCSLTCFKPFRISLNFLLWYLFHFLFSRPITDFSCL